MYEASEQCAESRSANGIERGLKEHGRGRTIGRLVTTGWKLDRAQREQLLARFPPRYKRAVADHVTFRGHAGSEEDEFTLPAPVGSARIVGRADDGEGVEAMVVEIDANTRRPDGKTWHVTWSLASGRHAKESNDLIRQQGWTALDGPEFALTPARW